MKSKPTKNTIPAVDRTIQLLNAISNNTHAHTVTELANLLDISVTTCFRIICTLEEADWIYSSPSGGYRLSAGLIRLLEPLSRYQAVVEALKPCLHALSGETRRLVKVSVRQGDEAVTIHREEYINPYFLTISIGARFALPYGSSGTALLADSSDAEVEAILKRAPDAVWANQTLEDFHSRRRECRAKGYCRDFGGYHPSVYTLSAPIRDAGGKIVCSVTLLGLPSDFVDKKEVAACQDALLRCVKKAKTALSSIRAPKDD